jgi:glycosyltransferase involved in cell wall biosynthesis
VKLLQIYNQYRSLFGGEETVARQIEGLVEEHGGEARLLMRSSRGLDKTAQGRVRAFVSGIYNPFAARAVAREVEAYGPDIVHVHNLYPLFSPSVLVAIRKKGVPIVMTVHNHFHTCPTVDHLRKGKICELCVGGREYNCFFKNCRGHVFESLGYAVRSAVARKFRLFVDNVNVTIALNEFARGRLILAGFEPERIAVLPNMGRVKSSERDASRGEYALFSGRMCPEKGAATLLEAAAMVPEVPVRLAGDGPTFQEHKAAAPTNAEFLGQLSADAMDAAYAGARFLVVPSRWFEGCPLVISEAMGHGLPVIASRIGGLPELVEDGETGLLFQPGNAEELAEKMAVLWNEPETCRQLGKAGREKAVRAFNKRYYWDRLQEIYNRATEHARTVQP